MTQQTRYLFNTPEPTADPIDRLFDAERDEFWCAACESTDCTSCANAISGDDNL